MSTIGKGWRTPDELEAAQRAYEDMLVDRLTNGLPLTKTDKREARRIAKSRSAIAKATT